MAGVTLKNNAAHRQLELQRLAKIAVSDLREVVSVLREDRLIQSKRVAKLLCLARCSAFTKHLFDGVTGNNMNQQKN